MSGAYFISFNICYTWTCHLSSPHRCATPNIWLECADQMCEFRLFRYQLDTWTQLFKIKAEECLDYLLCILGKEGYASMDHWVPSDEAHKWDLEKFLDYLESTLDEEISPWVQVYELEDIKKRSDESVNELIDRICQLAHHAQIGNDSNAAIEFEVQCRLIGAIPDADIKLWKELLNVNHQKRCHIYWRLVIHITPLSLEQLQHVLVKPSIPSTKAISPRKTSNKGLLHSAPTAPIHTPWLWQLSCTKCYLQGLF